MIRPNARNRLTYEDFEFISETLAEEPRARAAILNLLATEEERDALLDMPQLFERLLAGPDLSPISPYLYFYVLIRRVLREFDIEDREVADYLATMLTEFSRGQRSQMISDYHDRQYRYLIDLLKDLLDAEPEERFMIQSHLGNYSMFLAGVYPDYIYYRRTYKKMAPDFSYYEQMGSTSYQQAAKHRLAEELELAEILETLGTKFRKVRLALNYMVDRYMHMDRKPQSMDRVFRRLQDFIQNRKKPL
ncbi:MAG: hypothetical protein D6743_07730 [Calditrichaeota bacterium]|nr:MAG: hypothetical protein D6743_07730 [Calditrichota bacterium]